MSLPITNSFETFGERRRSQIDMPTLKLKIALGLITTFLLGVSVGLYAASRMIGTFMPTVTEAMEVGK